MRTGSRAAAPRVGLAASRPHDRLVGRSPRLHRERVLLCRDFTLHTRAAVRETVGTDSVACLVHAAGIECVLELAETDRQTFNTLVATNLAAPLFLTQAMLPRLGDGSSVVFVGSIAAFRGRDRHAAYAASKAGLLGLTVNLAAELAPSIRVNCICVGATRTGMMQQAVCDYVAAVGEARAQQLLTIEKPRLLLGVAEPSQIAASIAFLALDATFSTGTVLYADGGYTAR